MAIGGLAKAGLDCGKVEQVSEDYFEKDIPGAYANTTVRVVSVARDKHLNVVIWGADGDRRGVTLNLDGIKELRDTLNELHPPEPEVQPYEVREGRHYTNCSYRDAWHVVQKVPSVESKLIATAETEEQAKKIAQALNEAEGL